MIKKEAFAFGQATVEYIIVLAIIAILGTQLVGRFTGFFQNSLGGVAHYLSTHLIVGVCQTDCWFSSYFNGRRQQ
jgi:hypothetical protein